MSLRDQLKKANLLSNKDDKRLAHEARVERKEKGHEQLEKEQQQKQQELQQKIEQERLRTQQEQKQIEAARAAREEAAAVEAILQHEAQKPGHGGVRFYFETEDGSLPWVEVSPREAQELRAGQLCVVTTSASSGHDYRLLGLELTRRVARIRREAVVLAPRGIAN